MQGGLAMMRCRTATAAMQVKTATRTCAPPFRRMLSTGSRALGASGSNESENGGKPRIAGRASGFEDTVWVEFTPLAQKHGAVNLSQVSKRGREEERRVCVCVCVWKREECGKDMGRGEHRTTGETVQ